MWFHRAKQTNSRQPDLEKIKSKKSQFVEAMKEAENAGKD